MQSLCYRDTFKNGQIDLEGIIAKAAEYRMDGIDIHWAHFASTDDEYLEHIRRLCLEAGLHICYIGISNNFLKTGAEWEEQIEMVKGWIDVADRMGIQMVRVFGGWIPEGDTEEDAWPRLVDATKQVTAGCRSCSRDRTSWTSRPPCRWQTRSCATCSRSTRCRNCVDKTLDADALVQGERYVRRIRPL